MATSAAALFCRSFACEEEEDDEEEDDEEDDDDDGADIGSDNGIGNNRCITVDVVGTAMAAVAAAR